ncbi:hypothetical protein KS18_02745 [Photorhabdus luminescens]|nr:hypothetical protein KS18_02745 [Photorhabdus luminescens]
MILHASLYFSLYLYKYKYASVTKSIRCNASAGFRPVSCSDLQINRFSQQIAVYQGLLPKLYNGDVVQQIDFNDGHSADDLTMPGYNGNDEYSGQIQYNSGNTWGTIFDVLNFKSNDFLEKFEDRDGIDGGEAAKFKQYIDVKDDSIIVLDISI